MVGEEEAEQQMTERYHQEIDIGWKARDDELEEDEPKVTPGYIEPSAGEIWQSFPFLRRSCYDQMKPIISRVTPAEQIDLLKVFEVLGW